MLQVTGEAVVLSDIQLLPCGVIRSSFEAFQQHRANRSAVDIWQEKLDCPPVCAQEKCLSALISIEFH